MELVAAEEVPVYPAVSDNIPQFVELEKLVAGDPSYPDLHPEIKRPTPKYVAKSPVILEEEKEQGEDLMEFCDRLKTMETQLLPQAPKVRQSVIGRLIDDFQEWRQQRPRRRYVNIQTAGQLQKLLHDLRNADADVPPFAPDFIIESSNQLARCLAYHASTEILLRAGLRDLNTEELATHGLMISNFRTYHRTPEEMARFYSTFESLLSAGFTRLQFDSRIWTLRSFAKSFKMEPSLMANLCNMQPRDLLYAGIAPTELPEFGIDAEKIFSDSNPFELLFAINLPLPKFQELFHLHPHHFFKEDQKTPVLTVLQHVALVSRCNWHGKELEAIGCTKPQLVKLGMMAALPIRSTIHRK